MRSATTLLAAVLFVSAVALIGLNVGRYLVAVGAL
jgi:hypothetical protein